MLGAKSYTDAMPYEVLMRRAYNNERSLKDGADMNLMKNLIDSENGVKQHGLGSTEKQLDNVRTYLVKAADKFLNMKLEAHEYNLVQLNRRKLISANSSSQLLDIIDELLNATRRLK